MFKKTLFTKRKGAVIDVEDAVEVKVDVRPCQSVNIMRPNF